MYTKKKDQKNCGSGVKMKTKNYRRKDRKQ
jgi:hypothetical protein